VSSVPSVVKNPGRSLRDSPERSRRGRTSLAQRFSAGKNGRSDSSPGGTTQCSLTNRGWVRVSVAGENIHFQPVFLLCSSCAHRRQRYIMHVLSGRLLSRWCNALRRPEDVLQAGNNREQRECGACSEDRRRLGGCAAQTDSTGFPGPRVLPQQHRRNLTPGLISPSTSSPPGQNPPASHTRSQSCLYPSDRESALSSPAPSPATAAPPSHSDPPTSLRLPYSARPA